LTALTDPPHGGQQDLRNKVLRHVTDAFREDPARTLRAARFAARFADFSIAPETMQLMRGMVAGRPLRMLAVCVSAGSRTSSVR
jgi:tRNA nucleotidyltransferase (CCA-adding enzyme)